MLLRNYFVSPGNPLHHRFLNDLFSQTLEYHQVNNVRPSPKLNVMQNDSQNLNDKGTTPLNGTVVLLAEDNELNILVATKFLEKWGAKVDVARNGVEAVNKFHQDTHHLVLMDLHMPLMDGYQATLQLRKQGAKIPIVALTASILSDENAKMKANGFTGVVIKPFEPKAFLNTLIRSLDIFYNSQVTS